MVAGAGTVVRAGGCIVEDDRQDLGEVRYITIGFPDEAVAVLVRTPATTTQDHHHEGAMNENDGSMARDLDPDTAPDLSKDGWPGKFAKAAVRRGRPPKAEPKVSTAAPRAGR